MKHLATNSVFNIDNDPLSILDRNSEIENMYLKGTYSNGNYIEVVDKLCKLKINNIYMKDEAFVSYDCYHYMRDRLDNVREFNIVIIGHPSTEIKLYDEKISLALHYCNHVTVSCTSDLHSIMLLMCNDINVNCFVRNAHCTSCSTDICFQAVLDLMATCITEMPSITDKASLHILKVDFSDITVSSFPKLHIVKCYGSFNEDRRIVINDCPNIRFVNDLNNQIKKLN